MMDIPENPKQAKQALIKAVFEKMMNFRPEPTDATFFEGQYLTDTGKMLIDLSRKIEVATSENFLDILSEVEDFGFYIRDPDGYQRSLDEEIEAKREEKKRQLKAEGERISQQIRAKPDMITKSVEEVNSLLEAML